MIFRIIVAVSTLAILLAGWRIFSLTEYYAEMREAPTFAVRENAPGGNRPPVLIVEFLDYGCASCKASHRVLLAYLDTGSDVRLAIRPVPFTGSGERAALLSIAAGLQGRFWDADDALSRYDGVIDEKFVAELCALLDLDRTRLEADMASKKVHDIAASNAQAFMRGGFTSRPAFMVGKSLYALDEPLTLNGLVRMLQHEKSR